MKKYILGEVCKGKNIKVPTMGTFTTSLEYDYDIIGGCVSKYTSDYLIIIWYFPTSNPGYNEFESLKSNCESSGKIFIEANEQDGYFIEDF